MLPVLRKLAQPDRVRDLVKATWGQKEAAGRPCPGCRSAMSLVALGEQEPRLWLDVCRPCQMVWFDRAELASFAPPEAAPTASAAPKPELPMEAKLAFAKMQIEADRKRLDRDLPRDDTPKNPFQAAAAYLGLPGELNEQTLTITPIITWGLAAIIVVVGAYTLADPTFAIQTFGLIPEQRGRFGGLTFLTSAFVHGGMIHLLSNLYFLLVFGDNVEDSLGHGWFLLLFLLAALSGAVAHASFDPRPGMPVVGASGGISAMLAYYALAFPRARIGMAARIYWKFVWFRMPVWVAFGLWFALQILGAFAQSKGCTTVSAFGHLGGVAVGVLFWLVHRSSRSSLARA